MARSFVVSVLPGQHSGRVFFEPIDAHTLANLRLCLSNAEATWSAPPRTIGMGFSVKL